MQHNARPRKNISAACSACKSAKIKCDGQQPCRRCLDKGNTHCDYSKGQDRRTRLGRDHKSKELGRKGQVLDNLLHQIGQANDDQATEFVALLRTNPSINQIKRHLQLWQGQAQLQMPSVGALPASIDSDTESYVDDREASLLIRSDLGASLDALSFSDTDDGQRRSAPGSVYHTRRYQLTRQTRTGDFPYTFSTSTLPPEQTVRLAAKFFFSDISGLFYIMSEQDFESLATEVFTAPRLPSLLALTEVCAIAAVGSQYHPDHISDAAKEAFFRTALQHINCLLDTSHVRSMRTLACLGAYGVIEKRHSSRSFLHLGLQLARWNVTMPRHRTKFFAKLWRTLVFLDCWLSASLGYEPDLLDSEITSILLTSQPLEDERQEMTQQKMCEVALLRLQIVRQVAASGTIATANIEDGMATLTQWHQSLPEGMSLANLVQGHTEQMTWGQQGALFLSHTMYLGAVVLLHRHAVLAAVNTRSSALSALEGGTYNPMQEHEARPVDAARSMVRIFVLLGFDTERASLPMRCWLSLHEIFMACVLLLYGMTVTIFASSADLTLLRDDLQRVESCLHMMRSSANLDGVSMKMYTIVSGIHEKAHAMLISTDPREYSSNIFMEVRDALTDDPS